MLNLPVALRNALSDDSSDSIVLVDLLWPSAAAGPQYFTDNPYPITFESNEYVPTAGLLSVSTPQATSIIDRDTFNITLSNNTNAYDTRIEAAPTGVPVEVRVLLKQNGQPIAGSLPVYRGISSGASFQTSDGDRVLALEFTSPLTKLTQTNERLTTDASQREASTTDTSMIHVQDSVNEASTKWGRT